MSVKLFIYLAVIAIIAVLSGIDVAHAKPPTGMSNLKNMDEPPKDVPEFESHGLRLRRDVDLRAADEGDVPKEVPNAESPLRTRRQAPPQESDIPKKFQKDDQLFRAKRQMPSPPQMPMPPI